MPVIRSHLLSARWTQVTFPKRVLKAKEKKYARTAKYFLKSGDELFLTLTTIGKDKYAIKTMFWMNPELAMKIPK